MNEATDAELLRRYAKDKSEAAFAELVRRRVNLVYSVALRQCGGDAQLAEDVTQKVFVDLARKATTLASRAVLSGWLYRSAQFAASDVVRTERRRRVREQESHLMEAITNEAGAPADWEKLRPLLDEALAELEDADRDAVALRFLENRAFGEIGAALQLSEDGARKRVERALDKLHGALTRRGVNSTAAALALAVAQQAGIAAPAGLAASVTGVALASTSAGTVVAAVIFMGMTKLQLGIVGAVAIAGATALAWQNQTNANLRREIASVRVPEQTLAALRAENQQLAGTAAEVETLRRDDVELKRLQQRTTELMRTNDANARAARTSTPDQRRQFIAKIHSDEQKALAELEKMNQEGNALVTDYKALAAKAQDTALTPEARVDAATAAQARLDEIKQKRAEISMFTENTRRSLLQRIDVFRRLYGDDPNEPLPSPQIGSNSQFEARPSDNGTTPPETTRASVQYVPAPRS